MLKWYFQSTPCPFLKKETRRRLCSLCLFNHSLTYKVMEKNHSLTYKVRE
ncbi:hypothetical protein HMPREF9446_03056 [Bacteroides fluxus YIT 12057]|uniref:Uncharacterized protein n=1 Tax=Bacteroides fluxus YIT 12057 TaxID=763034 RepID=F3PWC2_9BACE|nr:hypothetical protein HMPREF9446_03056 [Bacteroides fluxus YIT 12057]